MDIKAKLGDAKMAKLTREAVQDCIDGPRKRGVPGSAAHVYRTLRAIVNFALKRNHIPGADPMRGVENPRPYRPAPVVAANDAEVTSLLNDIERSQLWPATKLSIEFQLPTGARPIEIRLATWDEIDTARQVWTLPAERVKSDREHRIYLSKPAVALLERARKLPRAVPKDGTPVPNYIFPGARGAAMEKRAVGRALNRLASRAEGEQAKRLRPHDVRRTLRTMMSRIGVDPHIAELCIGHLEKETMRRVYDGHDYWNEMVDAWDRVGQHIEALRRSAQQATRTPRTRGRDAHHGAPFYRA